MKEGFLNYKNSQVHFIRFGQGTQLLICIHGFADQGETFLALQESLENTYTVYCLDLPFHGSTTWNKAKFTPGDLSAFFNLILKKENKSRFDLMGFSLGGRIVLKMLAEWIDKVDTIYLIAPDGLDKKVQLRDGLTPRWLKRFLRWSVKDPRWFLSIVKRLYQWKLMQRFTFNFMSVHLSTEDKRNRLFGVWESLGHFKVNTKKVKHLIEKYPINIQMYFGEKDTIIPLSIGKHFQAGLSNVQLHVIDHGHKMINEKLDDLLKAQQKKASKN